MSKKSLKDVLNPSAVAGFIQRVSRRRPVAAGAQLMVKLDKERGNVFDSVWLLTNGTPEEAAIGNKAQIKAKSNSKWYHLFNRKKDNESQVVIRAPQEDLVETVDKDQVETVMRAKGWARDEGKELGRGRYGVVYEASYRGEPVACKVISQVCSKSRLKEGFTWIEREVEVIREMSLRHENIVRVLKVFKTEASLPQGRMVRVFIFTERGSDLEDIIRSSQGLNEPQTKKWFRGIVAAVHYMHSKGFAHRDIKTDNIIIDSNGNAKLTDFGFSRFALNEDKEQIKTRTICGTHIYYSPDLMRAIPTNPFVNDVWALGITLFRMVTTVAPFCRNFFCGIKEGNEDQINIEQCLSSKFKQSVSPLLRDLIYKMLDPVSDRRITVDGIRNHQWLS